MDTAICPRCGESSDASARHCSRCGTRLTESGAVDFLGARLRQRTEGRYRIGDRLGSGGMAAVYEARDSLDRRWAIKVLSDVLLSQPDMVQRFEREARTVLRLRHPNIVQLHSFEPHEDLHFLVLEFVEGVSLGERLSQPGGVTVEEGLAWFGQLADALDYAHSQQVIHRDIKPDNILVRASGDVVITDFGIAKVLGGVSGLTHTGMTIGTGYYMSPEQWLGSELTGAADQYALGVVLFEMLSGRRPFEKNSITALMTAHLTETPPDLAEVVADLAPGIGPGIGRMLSKDPEDRFPTLAEAVAAVLGQATAAGTRVEAVPGPEMDEQEPDPGIDPATPVEPPAAAAGPSVAGPDELLRATDVISRGDSPSGGEAPTAEPPPETAPAPPPTDRMPVERGEAPPPRVTEPPLRVTEPATSDDEGSAEDAPTIGVPWTRWLWVGVAAVFLVSTPFMWRGLRDGPAVVESREVSDIRFDGLDPLEIPGVGETRPVRIAGTDGEGQPASPEVSEWVVDDPRVAAVEAVGDASAQVTGLQAGETVLRASSGGLTTALTIRVAGVSGAVAAESGAEDAPDGSESGASTDPPPVAAATAFALEPAGEMRLQAGEERRVTARGDAGPMSSVGWSVADPRLLETGEGGSGEVVVRGLAPGRTVLRAEVAGVRDSIAVVIEPEAVASVVVDAESLALTPGEGQGVSATVRGVRSPRLDRPPAWSSRDPSVATVDRSGVVQGVADGETWVVAGVEGLSDSVRVRVSSPAEPVNGTLGVEVGEGSVGVAVSFALAPPTAATFCVVTEVRVGDDGGWIRAAPQVVEAGAGGAGHDFTLSFQELGLPEVGNAERRLRTRALAWRGGCPPPPGQDAGFTVATGEVCLVRYITRDWAVTSCG